MIELPANPDHEVWGTRLRLTVIRGVKYVPYLQKVVDHLAHMEPQTSTKSILRGPKCKKDPEGSLSINALRHNDFGAGDQIRTDDPNLGKVMLYP